MAYLTSRPTRACHFMITSCPAKVPTSYATSSAVLQVLLPPSPAVHKSSHILPYLTSCPASVSTSYPTSPTVLQEFPILRYLINCPASVTTYLTSCPSSIPTSYTRPQEFPHPTLRHRLSTRVPTSYTTSLVVHKSSHILHYLTGRPTRVPTSYTTSSAVLQVFPHPTLPHQLSHKSSRS